MSRDTIELKHASAIVGTIYSQNFKFYFIYDRLQTQENGYLTGMFFTHLEMWSCEIYKKTVFFSFDVLQNKIVPSK